MQRNQMENNSPFQRESFPCNFPDPKFELTNYLTNKLNNAAAAAGLKETVCKPPFGFYIRDDELQIVAACHGCVIFGGVYTAQIWVHPNHRNKGYARELMDKVHDYGREEDCKISYVMATNFNNGADGFLLKMGYSTELAKDSCLWQDSLKLFAKLL